MTDLKFAFRQLMKSPGFSGAAVLTLALCIAANLVIFSVTDAILIRSLRFSEPDRLVIAYHNYPGAGAVHQACSLTSYYEWRDAIPAFVSVAASRPDHVVVGDAAGPERIPCERVTAGFFETLGVKPALGRGFTEEEMDYSRSAVVMLTDTYWRNHFHADPKILGGDLRVSGQVCHVVGVLPPGFHYLSSRARLFFPLASSLEERGPYQRHNTSVKVIARLAPGVSLAAAQAQINDLNERQLKDDPRFAKLLEGTGFHTRLYGLHADHVRSVRPILLLLQCGALLLLLIGAVNLINLLLVRASGASREFSVRQALGAGRWHMARTVIAETMLLALGGGGFGLLLGSWGIRFLSVLGVDQLPLGREVDFSARVAVTALCGSILVGIAFALPVIGFHWHIRLASSLQTEGRGGTMSRAAQRLRHGFVVGQIALAIVLLTGAGLLGVSLQRALKVSPGFQSTQVLTSHLGLPPDRYKDQAARLAFTERLLADLRAQPGVSGAAVSTVVPFTGQDNNQAIVPEGLEPRPSDSIRVHFHSAASGGFWEALGIPLLQGRFLEDEDSRRGQRVCLVDETFARYYWPEGDALGRRIAKGAVFNEQEAFTIVGIVGPVKQDQLEEKALGAVYFPYRYDARGDLYVVTRSSLSPDGLTRTVRQTVQRLDPEVPVDDIRTLQARIDASLIQRRSPALLAGLFAMVALLLTAIGTYGVLAYTVSQRRREIGVRLALGAQPVQVMGQFLWLGLKLFLVGLAIGLPATWAVGRAMQSVLFGVGSSDPGVALFAVGVMTGVVLVAVLPSARRAARLDPMKALRAE